MDDALQATDSTAGAAAWGGVQLVSPRIWPSGRWPALRIESKAAGEIASGTVGVAARIRAGRRRRND